MIFKRNHFGTHYLKRAVQKNRLAQMSPSSINTDYVGYPTYRLRYSFLCCLRLHLSFFFCSLAVVQYNTFADDAIRMTADDHHSYFSYLIFRTKRATCSLKQILLHFLGLHINTVKRQRQHGLFSSVSASPGTTKGLELQS